MSDTYQSWHSMVRRCTWPHHKDYPSYGGRGITMDPNWINYNQFLYEMGRRPDGTTLGRIDNSKGYYKENCRWETKVQQANNRRKFYSNTSGCPGVSWQTKQGNWLVSIMYSGVRMTHYWGPDFFEACCRALSARNTNRGDSK